MMHSVTRSVWCTVGGKWLLGAALAVCLSGPVLAEEDWVQSFNGASSLADEPSAVVIDAGFHAYVTGAAQDTVGGFNAVLLKYGNGGTLEWSEVFDGSPGDDDIWMDGVAVGADGVVVSGFGIGSDSTDMVTSRYDADGQVLWSRSHDASGDTWEEGLETVQLNDGSVVTVGIVGRASGERDIGLVCYDADGGLLWSTTHSAGAGLTHRVRDAELGVGDEIVVVGEMGEVTDVTGSTYDLLAVAFEAADGAVSWSYTYDSGDGDSATGMAIDGAGDVAVVGQSGLVFSTITVIRLLADGSEDWVATYLGDGLGDAARDVAVDGSGNILVVGYRTTSGGTEDYVALKYDDLGSLAWERTHDGSSGGADTAVGVVTDDDEAVYVTGSVDGTELMGQTGIFTIKYSAAGAEEWSELYEVSDSTVTRALEIARDDFGKVFVAAAVYPDSIHGLDIALITYGGSPADAPDLSGNGLPTHLEFGQSSPNPAFDVSAVRYAIPLRDRVRISMFDATGRLLARVLDEEKEPGYYQADLPVRGLPSGVYFYRLEWRGERRTRKLTISK